MSRFSYADVVLPYAYCPSGSIEVVRDGEGDTDWCLTKFDLSIQSVISPAYLSQMGVQFGFGATASPALITQALYNRLMQHRKRLSYTFGSANTELIPPIQDGNAGTVDAANGPKPVGCTITNLTNNSFLVSFRIIAHYWTKYKFTTTDGVTVVNNEVGNNVLSNRWTEVVTLDGNQYSSRIRRGIARIRSDNASGFTADSIRSVMCVVSVPMGFVRDRSSYTIQPDGLAIQYEQVDREVFLQPPEPAFTASGEYTESGADLDITRYGAVQVTLTGRKDTIRGELIATAVGVAASKLLIQGAAKNQDGSFTKLTNAAVSVPLWKNEVTVGMTAMMNPRMTVGGKGRKAGATGINFHKFLTPPVGSEPGTLPPAYTDRGSASLFLQAAAYYDPSLRGTTLRANLGQLSTGKVPGQAGKQGE